MMSGLVERLRAMESPDGDEAADAIEALETDVVELRSERDLHKSRFENLLMLTSRERDALTAENAELRRLIARAYRAHYRDGWEDSESWDEVAQDLRWEGIDSEPAKRAALRGREG